ncbi:MAG TPA: hypothetical protein VKB46_12450, partial [Pyrinomonadaceae bacterium]|nr:hypothetical protein [Pyrinomonadaceae bacterium]
MKRLLAVGLLSLIIVCLPPQRLSPNFAAVQSASNVVAISGATLIDGSGRPSLRDSVVVITGDSISAVGRRSATKIPEGSQIIDARGLTIAPGFIDTHNHSD